MCSHGNLHLHKFISNNSTVTESIPVSERASKGNEIALNKEDASIEGTLGVQWKVGEDKSIFQVQMKHQPDTRRGILSVVAVGGSVYEAIIIVNIRGRMGRGAPAVPSELVLKPWSLPE